MKTYIHTKEYFNSGERKNTGLAVAPGLMIGDEVIPIDAELSEKEIERIIQSRFWSFHIV